MHVGDHAGDPAHVEVLAACAFLAGQQVADVGLHRRFPMPLVGHVDGKFLGGRRNLHVLGGQHELALLAVQGESVGAMADGQHQLGAGPVDAVAGGDLLAARLQERVIARQFHVGRAAQHREDGADRDVDVDVGAAIEGIEQQQEVATRIDVRHRLAVVHFFRGAGGEVATPGVGFEQDLVADDVQLLLRFALHVAGTGLAQHAAEGAFADGDGDAGAGAGDDRDQLAQVGIDAAGVLFLDQEAGQRSTGHERAGLGSGKTPIVARMAGPCVRAGRRNRFQMRCAVETGHSASVEPSPRSAALSSVTPHKPSVGSALQQPWVQP